METAFIEALCFPTWYHLRYFSQSVIVHIFMFLPYHLWPGTHPRDTRQSWGRSHHDKNWGMQEDSPVSWIYRVHVWRFLLCKFIQRLTFAHFPESLFFWFHVFPVYLLYILLTVCEFVHSCNTIISKWFWGICLDEFAYKLSDVCVCYNRIGLGYCSGCFSSILWDSWICCFYVEN